MGWIYLLNGFEDNDKEDKNDEIIQSLNKSVLECQCGFRRYLIKPIFSVDINKNSDKIIPVK